MRLDAPRWVSRRWDNETCHAIVDETADAHVYPEGRTMCMETHMHAVLASVNVSHPNLTSTVHFPLSSEYHMLGCDEGKLQDLREMLKPYK